MYVAFGNPVCERISFSLKSLQRLWIALAVLSGVFRPLNATSSVFFNKHEDDDTVSFAFLCPMNSSDLSF